MTKYKIIEEKIIIKVSELLDRSQQYSATFPNAFLELSNDTFTISTGNITYNFIAEKIGSEVLIKGTITAPFLFRCSRCNEFFEKNIVIEDFTKTYQVSSDSELIDLTNDVREDILLALPPYWICSENCKGLCFKCGTNLNKSKCKCEKRSEDKVWNILDRITIKRK